MNKEEKLNLIILCLGLVFCSILGFHFNLNNGLEFKFIWFYFPSKLIDYAGGSSNQLFLTSHIIGYVFYLIFGIRYFKKYYMTEKTNKILFSIYFTLIALVFISEFYSYYQELTNQFTGRHLRIGLIVFQFGFEFFRNYRRTDRERIILE